jgi:hypothetical protein
MIFNYLSRKTTLLKRLIKISYVLLAGIIGLLMLLYLLFNSYKFQNYLTLRVSNYLNETYHTRISIGEISYDGWTFFSLREVLMGDQKQDTTFYVGRLQFSITGVNIDSSKFILSNLVIDEAVIKVNTYKDSTYTLDVLNLFSNPNDTIVDPNSPPFKLVLKDLEVMDTRLEMVDSTSEFYTEGFDPSNIQFSQINFRSKRFNLIDDSFAFDLKNFSCKERSGFEITRLKANTIVSARIIELKDLDLVTPHSRLRNYFSMSSKGWKDYSDFNSKVKMAAKLRQSEIDMKDLVYFAPQLKDYKYKIKLSADLNGPVKRLSAKNVVASIGSQTRFAGSLVFNGLPNIDETFMEINADYVSSVRNELEQIIAMDLPEVMDQMGKIAYRGKFIGFYNDFVSYGSLETAFGNAETDLNMKVPENSMNSEYSGKLKLAEFNLGQLLGEKSLGKVDLVAEVKGKGFDLTTISSNFTTDIAAITYNNYTYKDSKIEAVIHKGDMQVHLQMNDENLNGEGQLHVNLDEPYKHIDGTGSISRINLKPLDFHTSDVHLNTDFTIDFYVKDFTNHHGFVSIDDLAYELAGYNYKVNQIRLESEQKDEKTIRINSDFLRGSLIGEFHLGALPDQLKAWTYSMASNFVEAPIKQNAKQDFRFDFSLLSTSVIAPLFFPGYSISNFDLEGSILSEKKSIEIAGYVGNFNFEGNHLNQFTFKLSEKAGEKVSLLAGFDSYGKIDTTLIGEFGLKVTGVPNHLNLQYYIRDSTSSILGEFKHQLNFTEDAAVINYDSSWIGAGNVKWHFSEGKHILLKKENIVFENLVLSNGEQKLLVDGFYDYDATDKNISLKLEQYQLNTINQFATDIGVDFQGVGNGYFVYKNFNNRNVIIGNLGLAQCALDQDTLGDFEVNTAYKEENEKLLIDIKSTSGKIRNLKAIGNYDIPTNYLKLNLNFDKSKVNSFQAFVKDYVKLYQGEADLNANLEGKLDDLKLNGTLDLNAVDFRVDYLMTKYSIEKARFIFEDQDIRIPSFNIKDSKGSNAVANGIIKHQNFSNLNYFVKIDQFKNLQVLNTTSKDNELFYGSAYATGSFGIKGDNDGITMDIKALAEKGTKVMINPFGASTETGESYIHFVSYDTTQTFMGRGKGKEFGVGVNMDFSLNPNSELQVIFNQQSDDKIRAKGNGKIKMQYLPDGNFTMTGNYDLTEGDYRFSALNLVAKKFDLKAGSSLVWSGDPLTGRLNITGVYKLKTAINTIVNMETAPDPNVRVPVECIINIKGIVEKPEIGFDLNFPDLQSNITGASASELNAVLATFRREPELMNQQMLFLLISGSFVPINSSSNSSSSNIGNQTISDLISRQAAGLIGKAIPNLDVSMDVITASDPARGRTYVLSASKRFLDNRLELQTSVALDNTQSNVSATYQLNKNKPTKVKVFNKSGFEAIYNRNVVTSGLGLYYRKEFDDLNELFEKKKKTYN